MRTPTAISNRWWRRSPPWPLAATASSSAAAWPWRCRRIDLAVRLVAPVSTRVASLRAARGLSETEARQEIERVDAERREFVQSRFHKDPDDPSPLRPGAERRPADSRAMCGRDRRSASTASGWVRASDRGGVHPEPGDEPDDRTLFGPPPRPPRSLDAPLSSCTCSQSPWQS